MNQNKKIFGVISFCLMFLIIGGIASTNFNNTIASGSSIQIDREKAPPKSENPLEFLLVPVLSIPGDENYKAHSTNEPIQTANNIPFARLQQDEERRLAKQVSIALAEHAEFDDTKAISFLVLSSIRYEMENGVIYVSTSLPSPVALSIPLSFSGDLITLDNGKAALVTYPYRIGNYAQ